MFFQHLQRSAAMVAAVTPLVLLALEVAEKKYFLEPRISAHQLAFLIAFLAAWVLASLHETYRLRGSTFAARLTLLAFLCSMGIAFWGFGPVVVDMFQ